MASPVGLMIKIPERLKGNVERQKICMAEVSGKFSMPNLLQKLFKNKSSVKIWPLRPCQG